MTPEQAIRKALSYDPETGLLTWLDWKAPHVKYGAPAGGINPSGYVAVKINNKTYLGHRVAWLLSHGEWPTEHIDHKNGIRSDNRLCNLRASNRVLNAQNVGKKKSNRSGYPGVSFHASKGMYRATICKNRKCSHLGYFRTPGEASVAYLKAKKLMHPFYARAS